MLRRKQTIYFQSRASDTQTEQKNAKHNIVGYRVEQKAAKGTKLVQDFDEDYDAHAAPVSGCCTYCMCTT
ncbi:hypothetical protein HF086_001939 [Spodoptera exigua]|uniref:Uncharacterized protein n=1 Tax=Spodoptera exigua TaxID=7107 RepID=A0A922SFR4_SPOEX|nr:hypothetical protein HF086_001939 [Spodoptera exigua]